MDQLVDIIQSVGFPIAIVIWLLYDRLQRDKYIVSSMNNIATTLEKIEIRMEDKEWFVKR